MSVARVFRKASLQQEDRLPISTYEEAVKRLAQLRIDESVTDPEYHIAVAIVADIFWRSDKKVLRDVRVLSGQWGF